MQLSVIIVNWNVKGLVINCIRSIHEHKRDLSVEVIVVDNGSSDDSVEALRSQFPDITVMAMKSNLGFAKANNRAIANAHGKYIFVLNPDTEIQADSLQKLVYYLDTHSDVALVAPKLVNAEGKFQLGSVRRDPTLQALLMILLKIQHVLPNARSLKRYYFVDFDPDKEQDVDQIMGAAMCFRRSTLDRHGLFDEKFFLWFEEVDLCRRLRQAGERIVYNPEAQVLHHGGLSFKQQLPLAKQRIYNKSVIHYFFKHHGIGAAAVLMLAMPINIVLVSLYQLTKKHGFPIR